MTAALVERGTGDEFARQRESVEQILDQHFGHGPMDSNFGVAQEITSALIGGPGHLTSLADACHSTALEKGFWEDVPLHHLRTAMSLMWEVGGLAAALEAERRNHMGWVRPFQLDRLRNLGPEEMMAGLKLLLIVSECVEVFEALISNPEKEAEEAADILIRLLDYTGKRGINLDAIVAAKMAKNSGRPHKHGHNF